MNINGGYLQPTNTNTFNYSLCEMYLLDNADLKESTIKGYQTYLKQFKIWLDKQDIKQPTEDTIKAYKIYLKESPLTIATKNQYIRAIKHLFKWLDSRGIYKNIASDIKEFRDTNKHKKDSLTTTEVNKILNDIGTSNEVDLRDRAVILVASVLGLRASEIININISDIEQKDNTYIINILGKGYDEKNTKKAIPKEVYKAITDYLQAKDSYKSSDALFTSTSNRAKNKRLTRESLSQIIKNRFRASGFNSSKISLHSLRHLTANATLQATNNNIYKTQQYLRHQNTQTTEIYLSEQQDIDIKLANDVYNTIFNQKVIDKTTELLNKIDSLNTSDIDKVIDYINTLKMEVNNG